MFIATTHKFFDDFAANELAIQSSWPAIPKKQSCPRDPPRFLLSSTLLVTSGDGYKADEGLGETEGVSRKQPKKWPGRIRGLDSRVAMQAVKGNVRKRKISCHRVNRFLRTIAEWVYPNGFVTQRVKSSGDISWHKDRVFISEVFRFEELGFEEVEDRFYKVFFRELGIGEFDVEALRFRPVQILR
jgi:hypothetical protein